MKSVEYLQARTVGPAAVDRDREDQ